MGELLKEYIPIHLKREEYDAVVIAAGGNDLSNGHHVDAIAEDIIAAGLTCRDHRVKDVYICSVLPRRFTRYQVRRQTLNNILRELCKIFDFTFIENHDIILEHIDKDDVHLTKTGSSLLCKNIAQHLNLNNVVSK